MSNTLSSKFIRNVKVFTVLKVTKDGKLQRRKLVRFTDHAKGVIANAASYKSAQSCLMAIGRLKKYYSRSGSYGIDYHLFKDAKESLWSRYYAIKIAEADAADAARDAAELIA